MECSNLKTIGISVAMTSVLYGSYRILNSILWSVNLKRIVDIIHQNTEMDFKKIKVQNISPPNEKFKIKSYLEKGGLCIKFQNGNKKVKYRSQDDYSKLFKDSIELLINAVNCSKNRTNKIMTKTPDTLYSLSSRHKFKASLEENRVGLTLQNNDQKIKTYPDKADISKFKNSINKIVSNSKESVKLLNILDLGLETNFSKN